MLEEKTRETLRRSSEQTVQQMKAVQKKQRKQKKRLRTVITLLAFVALSAGGGALGRALRAEPVCRGQAGSRPCGGREGAVCADRPLLAG